MHYCLITCQSPMLFNTRGIINKYEGSSFSSVQSFDKCVLAFQKKLMFKFAIGLIFPFNLVCCPSAMIMNKFAIYAYWPLAVICSNFSLSCFALWLSIFDIMPIPLASHLQHDANSLTSKQDTTYRAPRASCFAHLFKLSSRN